jgi:hypothetical protein
MMPCLLAHRPTPEQLDRPLTREQLKENQRRLSMLSPHHVVDEYHAAWDQCRVDGDRSGEGSLEPGRE